MTQISTANPVSNRVVSFASAGTGKTYELTTHYVAAFLSGIDPAAILATTFTRKAAGEILKSVLTRLGEAVAEPAKFERLRDDTGRSDLQPEDVALQLSRLCRGLDRVAIATLDSFFASVIGAFVHDLGLPPALTTLEEDAPESELLRRRAIELLLEHEDHGALEEHVRALKGDAAPASVVKLLDRKLAAAHELFVSAPESAWRVPGEFSGLLADGELDAVAARMEQLSLEGARPKNHTNALRSEAGLLRGRDWEKLVDTGLFKKIAAGEADYYRKPIAPEIADLYVPLLGHARALLLADLERKTRALQSLLALYHDAYLDLARAGGQLLFRDVPMLLGPLLANQDAAELGHRLDGHLTHLLLDEFQDTNPAQYAIIKPFASRIAERPFAASLLFCVGDLKQSIYGWRGATPETFKAIGTDFPDLARHSSFTSRRSAQVVLDAVNRLFGHLERSTALVDKAPSVAATWRADYEPHAAFNEEYQGFVEVVAVPKDEVSESSEMTEAEGEDGEWVNKATLAVAARRVLELARARPDANIGVLVRSNTALQAMFAELGRLGVPCSLEGGTPIDQDPAVAVVLAALRLAEHPGDRIAEFTVLNSPLARGLGLTQGRVPSVAAVAAKIRRELLDFGLGPVVWKWAQTLASECDGAARRSLEQLVNLADAYEGEISRFVPFVTAQRVEAANPHPVRLMTIHKSKGLEFDIVVLPQLEGGLKHSQPLLVTRDGRGEILRIMARPSEELRRLEPAIEADHKAAVSREIDEMLCLLYVAMTRARHALHIFIPDKPVFSMASLVADCLGEGAEGETGMTSVIYSHGDVRWRGSSKPVAIDVIEAEPEPWLLPAHKTRPARGQIRVSPTGLAKTEMESEVEAEEPFEPGAALLESDQADPRVPFGPEARMRGTALHALFGMAEAEGEPSEAALLQSVRAVLPAARPSEIRGWIGEWRSMMANPGVRAALQVPPGARVYPERSFACTHQGRFLRGRFDRLVVSREGEAVTGVRVIDFKTDRILGGQVAERAELYRGQMEAYRVAAARMFRLAPEQVRVSLLFSGVGAEWEL